VHLLMHRPAFGLAPFRCKDRAGRESTQVIDAADVARPQTTIDRPRSIEPLAAGLRQEEQRNEERERRDAERVAESRERVARLCDDVLADEGQESASIANA